MTIDLEKLDEQSRRWLTQLATRRGISPAAEAIELLDQAIQLRMLREDFNGKTAGPEFKSAMMAELRSQRQKLFKRAEEIRIKIPGEALTTDQIEAAINWGSALIIADTNLIVYLLVEGVQTEAARACGARDPFWSAPTIWRHEFINVLALHLRTRGFDLEKCLSALELADEIVQPTSLRGSDRRIIEIASARKMATYDAQFLVASEISGAPLVTADRALIERSEGHAVSIEDFAAGR